MLKHELIENNCSTLAVNWQIPMNMNFRPTSNASVNLNQLNVNVVFVTGADTGSRRSSQSISYLVILKKRAM